MKKFISLLLLVLILSGCGNSTSKNSVENYMKKYKTLDSEVLVDLENTIKKENLTSEQEEKYREILKKQYKDLSFDIIEEDYDNDVSYVTLKIEVYDLYKAGSDAVIYLENNPQEFYTKDNLYDINKFVDYKLDKMKNTTERVTYTITLNVVKENNKYVIEDLTENDLKKIHGIYNYELS